ncbi:uncharacterized protein K460DRAFT_161883 [Cucurbitaria berberidis CBS 394.84]|uniref:Uncharacterized protein n=1 Tax=Cucurbitaria berberidis CBS 394.84 TaxID=1168544 RepID=A0A9P4GE50_9PLEO|nr:uncharacterized protein K460DRAFT_161883 [Cucurbitaria berberidis CBS 394.84]KAF1844303.1 hypothetical protein K460DRAFT_161883 [Cucurbitaria berberidis CBS 394.84]
MLASLLTISFNACPPPSVSFPSNQGGIFSRLVSGKAHLPASDACMSTSILSSSTAGSCSKSLPIAAEAAFGRLFAVLGA